MLMRFLSHFRRHQVTTACLDMSSLAEMFGCIGPIAATMKHPIVQQHGIPGLPCFYQSSVRIHCSCLDGQGTCTAYSVIQFGGLSFDHLFCSSVLRVLVQRLGGGLRLKGLGRYLPLCFVADY